MVTLLTLKNFDVGVKLEVDHSVWSQIFSRSGPEIIEKRVRNQHGISLPPDVGVVEFHHLKQEDD